MKIGDRCFVHGHIDEIRKDIVIIKNSGGYFGTVPSEVITVYDTVHPNWIPCSEKLPKALQPVLVTSDQGSVYISYIVHGEFEYGGNIVAWMPLPEPYREEK